MDLNIRGVDDVLVKRVKGAALEGGETLREWVIGALEARLGRNMIHVSEIVDYDVAPELLPTNHLPMVTATLPPMPKTATASPLVKSTVPAVKPAARDQYGNIEWWKVKLPMARVNQESQEDEMDQAQAWADKNPPVTVEDEHEPLTNWAKRVNHGNRVNGDLLDKLRVLYLAAGGERGDE